VIRPFACALAAALGLSPPALAQDAGGWAFEVGAATDYRSKEASKSDREPYAYAEAEWANASGLFYVAGAGATVHQSFGSDLELDAIVGARPQVLGYDLDLNVKFRNYPGGNAGADDDMIEYTADIARSIGPADGRVRVQYSPDNAGSGRSFTWVEARAGWRFTPRLKASATVGRREQVNNVDYTGWNLGVTYDLTRNLDLDVRWHDTDADTFGEAYEGALVARVSASF
jgi:uncharacterized protein (TIGR02001 family)